MARAPKAVKPVPKRVAASARPARTTTKVRYQSSSPPPQVSQQGSNGDEEDEEEEELEGGDDEQARDLEEIFKDCMAKQALNNKKQIKNGKAKLSQMFDEALVKMEGNVDEIAAINDRGVKLVKTLKAEEIAEAQSIAVYLEAMQTSTANMKQKLAVIIDEDLGSYAQHMFTASKNLTASRNKLMRQHKKIKRDAKERKKKAAKKAKMMTDANRLVRAAELMMGI